MSWENKYKQDEIGRTIFKFAIDQDIYIWEIQDGWPVIITLQIQFLKESEKHLSYSCIRFNPLTGEYLTDFMGQYDDVPESDIFETYEDALNALKREYKL